MSTFYAATVTIGRNIPNHGDLKDPPQVPMSHIRWAAFRASVRSVLVGEGLEVTASNTGHGVWQGSTEENSVTVALWEQKDLDTDDSDEAWGQRSPEQVRTAIAGHLAVLAAVYKQDAIAFAWGESILVTSSA